MVVEVCIQLCGWAVRQTGAQSGLNIQLEAFEACHPQHIQKSNACAHMCWFHIDSKQQSRCKPLTLYTFDPIAHSFSETVKPLFTWALKLESLDWEAAKKLPIQRDVGLCPSTPRE